VGRGDNELGDHAIISLQFKDAAGSVRHLVIDVTALGVPPEDHVAKVTSFKVDGTEYSDLPSWRQLARQLKTAKGFETTIDGDVDLKVENILSCTRRKEDGAPDCHVRGR
jgi:hypothetical protein